MTKKSRGDLLGILREIDPFEFEHLVADIWNAQGWETTVRSGSGDRGVDVEARRSDPFNRKQFIQVKRYSGENTIGSEMIRTYATLYQQAENVDAVVLVTTSSVTGPAKSLADDLNVDILTGGELCRIVQEHGLEDIIDEYAEISRDDSSISTEITIEDGSKQVTRQNGVSSTLADDQVLGSPRFRKQAEHLLKASEHSDFHITALASSQPLKGAGFLGSSENDTERPPAISLFGEDDPIAKLLTVQTKGIGIGSSQQTETSTKDSLTIYAFLQNKLRCFIGKDNHWDQLIIPYDAIIEIRYRTERRAHRIVLHTDDQTYHLWITGQKTMNDNEYDRTDLEEAILQIDSSGDLVTESTINKVDERQSRFGTLHGHFPVFALTVWWTFGIGNLLYGLFRLVRYDPKLAEEYHRPPLWENNSEN